MARGQTLMPNWKNRAGHSLLPYDPTLNKKFIRITLHESERSVFDDRCWECFVVLYWVEMDIQCMEKIYHCEAKWGRIRECLTCGMWTTDNWLKFSWVWAHKLMDIHRRDPHGPRASDIGRMCFTARETCYSISPFTQGASGGC
jgi:hypothetical protein